MSCNGHQSRGAERVGGTIARWWHTPVTNAKRDLAKRQPDWPRRVVDLNYLPTSEEHSMRALADSAFALGFCIAVGLAGLAPAVAQQTLAQQTLAQQPLAQQPLAQQPLAQQPLAQQPLAQDSYLYPPEVRVRPVVMVLDPRLERRYWDPRYCDFDRAASYQWRWQDGARR